MEPEDSQWGRDADHIARCDPDTIGSLVTELLSRRSLDNADGVDGAIDTLMSRTKITDRQEALAIVDIVRSALSRPSQNAGALAWRCAKCGCKSFSRVERQSDSGTKAFEPGPDVRCVECKNVSFYPLTPPAVTAGEAEPVDPSATAWMCEGKGRPIDVTLWRETADVWAEDGYTITPLYAGPPLPQVDEGMVERVENIIAHRIDLKSTPRAIAEQVIAALTPQPGGE